MHGGKRTAGVEGEVTGRLGHCQMSATNHRLFQEMGKREEVEVQGHLYSGCC